MLKEGMVRESSIQILVDNVEPSILFTVFQLVCVDSFRLLQNVGANETPNKPSEGWRWSLLDAIHKLVWLLIIEVPKTDHSVARKFSIRCFRRFNVNFPSTLIV